MAEVSTPVRRQRHPRTGGTPPPCARSQDDLLPQALVESRAPSPSRTTSPSFRRRAVTVSAYASSTSSSAAPGCGSAMRSTTSGYSVVIAAEPFGAPLGVSSSTPRTAHRAATRSTARDVPRRSTLACAGVMCCVDVTDPRDQIERLPAETAAVDAATDRQRFLVRGGVEHRPDRRRKHRRPSHAEPRDASRCHTRAARHPEARSACRPRSRPVAGRGHPRRTRRRAPTSARHRVRGRARRPSPRLQPSTPATTTPNSGRHGSSPSMVMSSRRRSCHRSRVQHEVEHAIRLVTSQSGCPIRSARSPSDRVTPCDGALSCHADVNARLRAEARRTRGAGWRPASPCRCPRLAASWSTTSRSSPLRRGEVASP